MELVNDNPVVAEAAAGGNGGIGPVNGDASSTNKATPRNDKNSNIYPMVTGEKTMTSNTPQKPSDENNGFNKGRRHASSFTVTCPDGSTVHLSGPPSDDSSQEGMSKNDDKDILTTSQIILGRGKYGIPSTASHVSRQACVLRMVRDEDDGSSGNNTSCVTTDDSAAENVKQYSLELVVLGSQPCRITRQQTTAEVDGENSSQNVLFAKSISQIIADNGSDFSPSSMKICHEDVIEPCDRPMECTLDDAKEKGCYHPYTVRFSTNIAPTTVQEEEKIDTAALFSEASRKIEAAAVQLDETKKTGEEQGECNLKEDSQDTVDVKATMAIEKDVEMKASEKDDSGDLVKSADEKNDVTSINAVDGKDEKAVTLTTIICGSMGTSDSTIKLDKSVENAEAGTKMVCSSDQHVKEGGEEEGSSVNLPPDSLKESPAIQNREQESS